MVHLSLPPKTLGFRSSHTNYTRHLPYTSPAAAVTITETECYFSTTASNTTSHSTCHPNILPSIAQVSSSSAREKDGSVPCNFSIWVLQGDPAPGRSPLGFLLFKLRLWYSAWWLRLRDSLGQARIFPVDRTPVRSQPTAISMNADDLDSTLLSHKAFGRPSPL